jgi:ABC-type polysaccharide/polyol phosphate transport system ATPase subunit/glycosyltransferase involved in cell wall biosynthesis
MAIIEIRDVVKSFVIPSARRATVREHVLDLFRPRPVRELSVLDGVSFEVQPGETVGLMGRNGSGKSTLLRIIAGIYRPDRGAVTVRAPMTPILELGLGWNPELDAVDNILLLGSVLGRSLRELRAAVDEILAFAELEAFANVKLQHYSSGMAARLAYAVAFTAPREVLLLDEIFAVGDAGFKERCQGRYRELVAAGRTVLLASHDAGVVTSFCDRALLLEGGRIVTDDAPARVGRAYLDLLHAEPGGAFQPIAAHGRPSDERPPAPKISVIVPCYNLGEYLDEAVQSVLDQTFQDFEIIVVNDGSTDPETNRLLADYDRPNTRVITTENRGLPSARNLAIEHATGEYICALDADDKLEPTYLDKAVRILDQDPSIAFVSSWIRAFGDEDWVWKQARCDLPQLLAECTVNGAALVRRSALLAVGGYDVTMKTGDEDWDLWITLAERGYRGTIIPEVLFHYRRRAGSMSTLCTEGETHLSLVRYLVDKHQESYRRHLFDILLLKEAEACDLLQTNYRLERHLTTDLEPTVERRRADLARLRAGLEPPDGEPPPLARRDGPERQLEESRARSIQLATALANAEREVLALRQSLSWRITAPVRSAYDLLRGRGRRQGV